MNEAGKFLPHPPGVQRFGRLRVLILTLGVSTILAFASASAYDAWRAYGNALATTHRELTNVATALAEQTAWTLEGVDLLLRDTARWYKNDSPRIPAERFNEVLANRTAGVRQIRLITITDAKGIQKYRSRGSAPPNLDVSDRSYFIAQKDGTAKGLFFSEPLVTRSEGRVAIVLSRRLEDGAGAFAGVVTAILDLEELQHFYGAVNLASGGAVQLLRDDGMLLLRNPPNAAAIGMSFPIDGRQDFVSIGAVRDTPFVLAVTREKTLALHSWRDEAIRLAVRTLLVALLGLLAIGALWRQLRRIETGEQALRESEERYALAMEGANEGHWDWNLQNDQLFLSAKMAVLEGNGKGNDPVVTTRAAWVSQIDIHPDDRARLEAAVQEHLEGRVPGFECEYRVRAGGWRWLLARGRCLRDGAGRPTRFVGSAIDVTTQKRAQLEKEELEAQLRQSQKMEAIGTLAGGIAHDFNNILGSILGYGELAQQESVPGGRVRRYVDNVMHAAERAKLLVDRILGFSRSGLGDRTYVHIQSVVEEALELISASLPSGIRLERSLHAGDAALIGDSTHLHQVAMNLFTNAIHAMERGGVLTVLLDRAELTEAQPVSRGSLAAGPYARLEIQDTGVGIAPAVLERMFDPFFTTRGVGEGTGLGLSLVHGIVADLGGAINVKSSVGEGTSFEVWLPISDDVAKPAAEVARELPSGRGETVLIVDDEPMLVALTEEMLAGLGYEPVGFASSRAALEALRAAPQRFDLILSDEAMPDLAGSELAREARLIRVDIPIILMTGHGGAALADQAAAIGVRDVLHKPLTRAELAESLARACVDIR